MFRYSTTFKQVQLRHPQPHAMRPLPRASRVAPRGGNVWGAWSEPVFICTTPPIEAELEHVGEDYAQISWKRASRDNLLSALPGAKLTTIAFQTPGDDVRPQPAPSPSEGCPVFVGDANVFRVPRATLQNNSLIGGWRGSHARAGIRDQINSQQQSIRISTLTANTQCEAFVCASVRSKEWGCWSNALVFKTSMPTEVRVVKIAHDAITVRWGKGGPEDDGHSDFNVHKYQLRIQGLDDDYFQEVELERGMRSFDVRGLAAIRATRYV